MTRNFILATLATLTLAAPALAGDAVKGEADFKKCKSCHAIVKPDGTEVFKGGKTGPNLWGVVGRAAGTGADFAYTPAMIAAGTAGKVWDEAMIAVYVVDPNKWVQEATGDAAAKTKMTFKLAKGGEDIAAYLALQK
jgi:cytochrome c